jgi:hypothetical protein
LLPRRQEVLHAEHVAAADQKHGRCQEAGQFDGRDVFVTEEKELKSIIEQLETD